MALPLRRSCVSILLVLTVGVAEAQQPVVRPASTVASSPATAASSTRSSTYRSAFEGYRSFAEQPLTPWREANDIVKSVGGWQAYAREGQGEPVAGAENATAMPAGHAGMDMRPSGALGTSEPPSGTPAPMSGTPAPMSGTPAPMSGTPAPMSGTPAPMSPAVSNPGPIPMSVKVPSASGPRPAANAASGTRPTSPTESKQP